MIGPDAPPIRSNNSHNNSHNNKTTIKHVRVSCGSEYVCPSTEHSNSPSHASVNPMPTEIQIFKKCSLLCCVPIVRNRLSCV